MHTNTHRCTQTNTHTHHRGGKHTISHLKAARKEPPDTIKEKMTEKM